jgi:hypothetical protein
MVQSLSSSGSLFGAFLGIRPVHSNVTLAPSLTLGAVPPKSQRMTGLVSVALGLSSTLWVDLLPAFWVMISATTPFTWTFLLSTVSGAERAASCASAMVKLAAGPPAAAPWEDELVEAAAAVVAALPDLSGAGLVLTLFDAIADAELVASVLPPHAARQEARESQEILVEYRRGIVAAELSITETDLNLPPA